MQDQHVILGPVDDIDDLLGGQEGLPICRMAPMPGTAK